VQASRSRFDFEAVTAGPLRDVGVGGDRDPSKAFRMIDDETVPVVVAYPPAAGEIAAMIAELRASALPDVGLLRRLQPYLVTLRRHTRERPDVAALCRPVAGELAEWVGGYDDQTGIVLVPSTDEYVL
jgi:CRISPR-associated endonuclease/helicase Cas3